MVMNTKLQRFGSNAERAKRAEGAPTQAGAAILVGVPCGELPGGESGTRRRDDRHALLHFGGGSVGDHLGEDFLGAVELDFAGGDQCPGDHFDGAVFCARADRDVARV